MDAASLQERVGQPLPFYVRKLDKKSSWGHESDELESRKTAVAKAVFDPAKLQFSLYLINSVEDLERVTVALNAGRHRLKDQVDYIAFASSEIDKSGVQIVGDALGETGCVAANELHVDITADDNSSFYSLCSIAIEENRLVFRVSKSEAKKMADSIREFGCLVFQNSSDATCCCQSTN